MPIQTYDASLPYKFLREGFTEEEPDLILRTKMDSPIQKQRRQFTNAVRVISGKIIMTAEQRNIMRDFYKDNCSIPFKFYDPYTGGIIVVRFLEKPTYQLNNEGTFFEVTLKPGKIPDQSLAV